MAEYQRAHHNFVDTGRSGPLKDADPAVIDQILTPRPLPERLARQYNTYDHSLADDLHEDALTEAAENDEASPQAED